MKEHQHGVDISHSHSETCCFSALVTPTPILMTMIRMCEYLHIYYHPPTHEWLRQAPMTPDIPVCPCHFQYIFLSLFPCLHHSPGVWLILPDSGDFNINHLFSLVCFHAQFLAAKPMYEAQQTESVKRDQLHSAMSEPFTESSSLDTLAQLSVRQSTSLVLTEIFWKHSWYSED